MVYESVVEEFWVVVGLIGGEGVGWLRWDGSLAGCESSA